MYNMAVTIHDLARLSGYNASTVSRALRGDNRVKEATRRQILELARENGYSPNLPARQLARGKPATSGSASGSPRRSANAVSPSGSMNSSTAMDTTFRSCFTTTLRNGSASGSANSIRRWPTLPC